MEDGEVREFRAQDRDMDLMQLTSRILEEERQEPNAADTATRADPRGRGPKKSPCRAADARPPRRPSPQQIFARRRLDGLDVVEVVSGDAPRRHLARVPPLLVAVRRGFRRLAGGRGAGDRGRRGAGRHRRLARSPRPLPPPQRRPKLLHEVVGAAFGRCEAKNSRGAARGADVRVPRTLVPRTPLKGEGPQWLFSGAACNDACQAISRSQ